MFSAKSYRRVTYGETDQMGYLYYGNYPSYLETGRTESLRSIGIVYKKLEENGIMMPVTKLELKYRRPAFYDDLLCIETQIKTLPEVRITFDYIITNESGVELTYGMTELIFLSKENGKPIKCPELVMEKLTTFFP